MKQLDIYSDFLLNTHNLEKGEVGYVTVTKLNINFVDDNVESSTLTLSFKRQDSNKNNKMIFLFEKVLFPFGGNTVQLNFSESHFEKALSYISSKDTEGLYDYFSGLVKEFKLPAPSPVDDDIPF